MNTHTIERISTISLVQVHQKLMALDDRVQVAIRDMQMQGGLATGAIAPTDMGWVPYPFIPCADDRINKAIFLDPHHWSKYGEDVFSRCRTKLFAKNAELKIASAQHYVEAIIYTEAYANLIERIASEYKSKMARAVQEYICEQEPFVRQLACLVGNSKFTKNTPN